MNIPKLKTKDLKTVTDLTQSEILELFAFTAELKRMQKEHIRHPFLEGQVLAMIFEKSSTRTRVSFESGIYQLGGTGLFLSKSDIQLGRGEPIEDTARVLGRYVDGIMIRTFGHDKVEKLAKYASVPVINGLSDDYHPCQSLADYFSIYEIEQDFSKVKLAYIGDGNNMAHSLMLTGALLGSHVVIASPDGYKPKEHITAEARRIAALHGGSVEVVSSVEEAAKDANYLYTDVWASMGQEEEAKERIEAFKGYAITMDLVNTYAPSARVMHCLPAHRGEEIEAEVIESEKHSIIFEEAENRLHIQKAVMSSLMVKE